MENSMEKESIVGQMDLAMKASLLKEFVMVKAVGSHQLLTVIFSLEATKTIKKQDMDGMFGRMGACTKVDFQTM